MSNLIVFNPPLADFIRIYSSALRDGRSLCPQFTGSEDSEREKRRLQWGPCAPPQPSAKGVVLPCLPENTQEAKGERGKIQGRVEAGALLRGKERG